MAKKIYINTELDWAEERLEEWKKYIDDNPVNTLTDRIVGKRMTASIETQIKSIRDTMKEYLQLLEVVDSLREKEEMKQEARGKGVVPHRMRRT